MSFFASNPDILGTRKIECVIWKMESGKCLMEYGIWKGEIGNWKLESGKWKVEIGKWKVEIGVSTFCPLSIFRIKIEC
jgi:hypothetical protein